MQTRFRVFLAAAVLFGLVNFVRFVPLGHQVEYREGITRSRLLIPTNRKRSTGFLSRNARISEIASNQITKDEEKAHSRPKTEQALKHQSLDENVVSWRDALACTDERNECKAWAQGHQCVSNAAFMLRSCSDSCGVCLHTSPATLAPRAKVQLASGDLMPTIGFGTAGLGDLTYQAVLDALSVGYKLIDSAQAREWYREDLVGKALKDSGISRSQLFLTSKLHPRHLHQAAEMVENSLVDLGTDYLDLFLLHYPRCWGALCGEAGQQVGTWQQAWTSLEPLVASGKIKALGVSNFDLGELSELMRVATIKPSVVQVRSDPLASNRLIQAFCRVAGVQFQAYSSLGTQWAMMSGQGQGRLLESDVILGLAEKMACSPVQVILRWALQHGQAVVPRSRSTEHMRENLEVIKRCALTESDMRAIDRLDTE